MPQKHVEDVRAKVIELIEEHLGVDPAEIVDNAYIKDDLGADSLDAVELTMAFEESFGIEIPDDAAEKLLKVSDIIAYLIKANRS